MVTHSQFHAIIYILRLRFRMAVRLIRTLGWIRLLLFAFLFIAAGISFLEILDTNAAPVCLFVFGILAIWGIHTVRKDSSFLQTAGINKNRLYLAEYTLLILPATAILVYLSAWIWLLGLLIGCSVIALIPNSPESARNVTIPLQITQFLPYEWSSGIREHKWTLFLLLIIGAAAVSLNLFAGWLFIFLLTATVVSFYRHCEPVSFILCSDRQPLGFIAQKVGQGAVYYLLSTSVLWVEMMIMYPSKIGYSLLFLLVNLLVLITVITGKYAFYRENMNIEMMIGTIFGIGCICLLVPYLPPVLLLLQGWLLFRANQRLKQEVYAFH